MKIYATEINGSVDYGYLEKSRAIEDIASMTGYDKDYVEKQIEDYGAVDDFYSIKEIDVFE
jgi:hypothetical protein